MADNLIGNNIFIGSPVQSEAFLKEKITPPPAVLISDVGKTTLMTAHLKGATSYKQRVQSRKLFTSNVEPCDIHAAHDFDVSCKVASMIPQIAASIKPFQDNDIIESIREMIKEEMTAFTRKTKKRIAEQIDGMKDELMYHTDESIQDVTEKINDVKKELLESIQDVTRKIEDVQAEVGIIGVNVDQLVVQIDRLEAKAFNSTAILDGDIIRSPSQHGENLPPAHFPTTLLGLKSLHPGDRLMEIEDYYHFNHIGELPVRLKRLRRAYGIGAIGVSMY